MIRLKSLLNESVLNELDFGTQKAFDDYQKSHDLRPDTQVTVAGKKMSAGQAAKQSKDPAVKGKAVFGKDKGTAVFNKKSSGGESNKSYDLQKVYKDFRDNIDLSFGDGRALQPRLNSMSRGKYTQTSEKGGRITFDYSDDVFDIENVGGSIKVTKVRKSEEEIANDIKDSIKKRAKGGPYTVVARQKGFTKKDGSRDDKFVTSKSTDNIDNITKSFHKINKKYGRHRTGGYVVSIEDAYGNTVYMAND